MNKIIYGDAIKVMKRIKNNSIDTIITDPPYNVVEKMGGFIYLFRKSQVENKDIYTKESMQFDVGFNQTSWIKEAIRVCKYGANIIIFNDWENMGKIAKELRKYKIKVKSLNHWQKTNPLPAEWRRRFVSGREYFLHSVKPGKYQFNVDKLNNGSFEYGLTKKSEKKFGAHPNQKPVILIEQLIRILSKKGDIILDPFAGSGTTGVACINTNRNYILIEKEKKYISIIETRINYANNEKKEYKPGNKIIINNIKDKKENQITLFNSKFNNIKKKK